MVSHDGFTDVTWDVNWDGICCNDGGIKEVLSQPKGVGYNWNDYCYTETCIFYKSGHGNKIFQCLQCPQDYGVANEFTPPKISSIEVYHAIGGLYH